MGAEGVYLDVILNRSMSLRALVDSGCKTLSVISPRTATACNATRLPIQPRPIRQVVDDPNPPVCSEIAVLNLDFGELSERLFAYVVPDQVEPLILGERWLVNHDASLRPAQRQVHIRKPSPLTLTTLPDTDSPASQISACAVSLFHRRVRRFGRRCGIQIFSATLRDIEKALKPKEYTDPVAVCPEWLRPVVHAFDR